MNNRTQGVTFAIVTTEKMIIYPGVSQGKVPVPPGILNLSSTLFNIHLMLS